MDFKQLNYFIAVYETSSFTASAGQLHISQQGLSKSIQTLERELDLPLFSREKNRLKPTVFGDLLYGQALRLRDEFQNTLTILENAKKKANRLKIGFASNVINVLNDIEVSIQRFRQFSPETIVEISNETDYACEEKIENGKLDVAFSMGTFSSPHIHARYLMQESIYALVPAAHRFAAREQLYISDICQEPLITSDTKNKGYSTLEEDFRQKGLRPHIAFWSDDPQTHFRLTQKNLGISLCPEHWLPLLSDAYHLKAMPVADIQKRKIYVIYKKNGETGLLLKKFLSFIL